MAVILTWSALDIPPDGAICGKELFGRKNYGIVDTK
jgi:hypothetical protein